jgi:hypothetical protein
MCVGGGKGSSLESDAIWDAAALTTSYLCRAHIIVVWFTLYRFEDTVIYQLKLLNYLSIIEVLKLEYEPQPPAT